jgi:hypothetical protein
MWVCLSCLCSCLSSCLSGCELQCQESLSRGSRRCLGLRLELLRVVGREQEAVWMFREVMGWRLRRRRGGVGCLRLVQVVCWCWGPFWALCRERLGICGMCESLFSGIFGLVRRTFALHSCNSACFVSKAQILVVRKRIQCGSSMMCPGMSPCSQCTTMVGNYQRRYARRETQRRIRMVLGSD